MIVLDASAVVDLLLAREPVAGAVARRIAREAPDLAAPHLLDAEVAQVLRRFVLKGFLPESSALYAMEDLRDLPLIRHGHGPFLERAFALRENATIYDALYLALAEALEAPLLTADAALAKVPGHGAAVEVLA